MRVPASKLRRPRLSRSVIDRTSLFRRMLSSEAASVVVGGEPPEAPVTLLSAPAGAGKTTLMSSWAKDRAERGARVAWVSLDRTDNDPLVFWSGVLAAVRLSTTAGDPAGGASAGPRPRDRAVRSTAGRPPPSWG